ncbi:MAG: hypothetical protein R3236_01540 [Phycisphaeraceae bacterium]|nr:hypothetical protein [Phycisphaeraceae bacterium]
MSIKPPGSFHWLCIMVWLLWAGSATVSAQRIKTREAVPGLFKAIERGNRYLASQYRGKGKFGNTHFRNIQFRERPGHTALAAYALMQSGTDHDDKMVAESLKLIKQFIAERQYVRKHRKHKETYDLAFAALFADAHEQLRQLARERSQRKKRTGNLRARSELNDALKKQMALQSLSRSRRPKKFFTYLHRDLLRNQVAKPGPWMYYYGGKGGDLSVTQYGIMGLWVTHRNGLKQSDAYWRQMADQLIRIQSDDGAWGYPWVKEAVPETPVPEGKIPTGPAVGDRTFVKSRNRAMTAAGICSLAVCYLHLKKKRVERQTHYRYDKYGHEAKEPVITDLPPDGRIGQAIDRGFGWLAKEGLDEDYPYYLYGLERACALTRTQTIGGEDWFKVLAAKVVARQKLDGSWDGKWGPTAATAWTLLFLMRTTEDHFNPSPDPEKGSPSASPGDVPDTKEKGD